MPTVLIVDDEQAACEGYKMLFEELHGIPCRTAANSDQALKIMAEQTPELVLLDIRLDKSSLDGFGILAEANKLPVRSKMKIVMMTGYFDEAHRAKAREMGADDYLAKPIPAEKLLEYIKAIGGPKA